jgi:subtilisin family serine protease
MSYGRFVPAGTLVSIFASCSIFAQSQTPKPLTPVEIRHMTAYSKVYCSRTLSLLDQMAKLFRGSPHGKRMEDTSKLHQELCRRADALRAQDAAYKQWLALPKPTTPTPSPAPKTDLLTPAPDTSTSAFGPLSPQGPNDQFYIQQNTSGLRNVNMMKAWALNRDCSKVQFSVFDTGADYHHPELKESYRPATSFDFVLNQPNAIDKQWHGTFVAGIIAGKPNNRDGVAGACWRANISSKAVLNAQGMGTLSDILRAMNTTTNATAANSTVSIWNLSISIMNQVVWELSSSTFPKTMNQAILEAGKRNILVVVAAGNENRLLGNSSMVPNLPKNLLVVGATDGNDKIASFSNYSGVVNIYAPGVNNISTASGYRYAMASGTSFSSPLVAGIAGLMVQRFPQLKAAQIVERIQKSARATSNTKGALTFQTPVIDGAKLLEAAQ